MVLNFKGKIMDFGITQKKTNGLTMVDFFCGAGIGAYGFKKAGYDIIFAMDSVQYAVDTYNKNIGNHAHCLNIKKINLADIPYADVYTAGFPCQPFSFGGTGDGIEDKASGDLGAYFFEAVKLKQPKGFIVENVKGITSKKHVSFFNELISNFENAGYNVTFKITDCYEYGVPQTRERVFIVGVRKDLKETFEFPSPLNPKDRIHLVDAIGDLPNPSDDHNFENHKKHYEGGFSPRFMSRNRQRQWNQPSFTICSTARQLPLHPEPANYDIRVRDIEKETPPRRFTVRECLRIQTVPDDFAFDDSIPYEKQQVRTSGIPSLISYKLSKELAKLIS